MPVTVYDMIERLKAVDIDQLTDETLQQTKDDIVYNQREQLLEGKMSTGDDITPGYLEDPYFKTKEAAQAYSDWKDKITPNPKRKKGTPNLFINGYYHSGIKVKIGKDEIITDADAEFAPDVERKYTNKLLGLMPEKTEDYAFGPFWSVLKEKLEQKTQLTFE